MKDWALVVGFLGLSSVALAQDVLPEPKWGDPCARFTPDATYVTSVIIMGQEGGKVNLRIPVDYFEDAWDQKDGVETTAQLFSVEIGSFDPVTRDDTLTKHQAGLMDYMVFTVEDLVSLKEIAEFRANSLAGLPEAPLASYTRRTAPSKLTEIWQTVRTLRGVRDYDLYLSETDNELNSVIACRAPGTALNLGCDHFFRSAGLDVTLDYQRSYLPYWQEIQSSIEQFLTCSTRQKL